MSNKALQWAPRNGINKLNHYFTTRAMRINSEAGAKKGEPIASDSGAIKSFCRQYPCRFKRPGQVWTTEGNEAPAALETLWRDGMCRRLFRHAITSLHS